MGSRLGVQLEQVDVMDHHRDIDDQVERILQHPLFHQSKRLPTFLRYIVNESLRQGGDGTVKERTVGVEVFGRRPDYDNNSDPIVRVTASELRKKLAQYYYEDGHAEELRIELPPGSYLPKFRKSLAETTVAGQLPDVAYSETPVFEAPAAEESQTEVIEEQGASAVSSRRSGRFWLWAFAALLLVNVVTGGILLRRYWAQKHPPLAQFWLQVAGNANRVFIVMPVIGSDNVKGSATDLRSVSVRPNLSLEDTNIAVRIASLLEKGDKPYQLVSSSEVTFDTIRSGPSVLIGALDNIWTIRLMQKLPFVFEEAPDHRTGRIVDTTSGGNRSWTVDIDMPHTRIAHDYGIVARFTNQMTGEPVVVIAGISSQGTQAAGELLSSAQFETIRGIAGQAGNFEIVIDTEAIDGQAGRPQIVASKTW